MAPLVARAAVIAAQRELSLVKAATQSAQPGAVGAALAAQRKFIGPWMGLTESQTDRYCAERLARFSRDGMPTDEAFVAEAAEKLIQLTQESQRWNRG